MNDRAYLLVNFGGPRSLKEIRPFLEALLTDHDVIRTKLPCFLQDILFRRVAKKRASSLKKDYELIGGGSPIYEDTEKVAQNLKKKMKEVITFHRYLESTHEETFAALNRSLAKEIVVFPLFPQFTYATTGSCARLLQKSLLEKTINKMRWVKSYSKHPNFISLFVNMIKNFMRDHALEADETILIFSAHGVPLSFIENGDPYKNEVEESYNEIMKHLLNLSSRLSFQSRFGPEVWTQPYTSDVCETIAEWGKGKKKVLFIPISFTSDHIETLFEIEQLYMPLVRERGFECFRLPAFNQKPEWLESIPKIIEDANYSTTNMLIR